MTSNTDEFREPRFAAPSLGEIIVEALERFSDRTAFISGDRRYSYADTARAIGQVLDEFASLGLKPGDTVAQLSRNRPEMWFVVAAAYVGGYRSVTLHPLAGREDQRFILEDSSAAVIVADRYGMDRVLELTSEASGVHVLGHDPGTGPQDLWGACDRRAPSRRLSVTPHPEDVVRLAYTGGTTGRPKGVMQSGTSLVTNTLLWQSALGLRGENTFVCASPVSHGAGSLVVPILLKGAAVELLPSFSVDTFLAAVGRHEHVVTYLVPTMIYTLLDDERATREALSSVETIIYSASPISSSRLADAIGRFGPVFFQGYGQTECPNTVLFLDRHEHHVHSESRLQSAGRPFPGISVSLQDAEGRIVQPGEVGEICVRGPLVMSGYVNQPELTAEVMRGGWLHTGDLARQDSEGYFHIVDRVKDVIITGGFNVYPREIELTLGEHPAVAQSVVFGVPDRKWGEAVTAAIIVTAGVDVTPDELSAYVRERKGPVAAPKAIHFVEELPVTGLGKIDTRALAARFGPESAAL